jgi:ankyrin repeat protein
MVTEGMLTEAAWTGDLESLTIWARQGVRITSAMPLRATVGCGHLDVVRCLVRGLGADVSQAMHDGNTPLISAAYMGKVSLVRLLVQDLGADINQGGQNGVTPLMVAGTRGHLSNRARRKD